MIIANERERRGILTIGGIVARTLDALCRAAKPGMATREFDVLARNLLADRNASPTMPKVSRFPAGICVSVNDEVAHGVPGDRILRPGDLVKFDLTADKDGFVADAARMVLLPPGDGLASRLMACAAEACFAAIAAARPGLPLSDLGVVIEATAARHGFAVVEGYCGHGVGRTMHETPEVPNSPDSGNLERLAEGMVIAIEPIISAGPGLASRKGDCPWTVITGDGSLAAHYEETVIVASGGAEVATKHG